MFQSSLTKNANMSHQLEHMISLVLKLPTFVPFCTRNDYM